MPQLNEFNRVKYLGQASVAGRPQLDMLNFQWERFNKFIEDRPKIFYSVPEEEAGRIDLIAHKQYQDVRLWWIVALANEILNPIDEVYAGRMLKIPRSSDIEEFQQKLQRNKRRGARVAVSPRPV